MLFQQHIQLQQNNAPHCLHHFLVQVCVGLLELILGSEEHLCTVHCRDVFHLIQVVKMVARVFNIIVNGSAALQEFD
jgi:hypothetical protein